MNILQICSKPPEPAIDGGCKAMSTITNGLLKDHTVKVLSISTEKHPFDKENIPKGYLKRTTIESEFIDTKVKVLPAFLNLFSQESYNITRFYSKKFEALIIKTLSQQSFDIILLEGLYVTPYIESIKTNCKSKIVYRAHNIESEIWERKSNTTSNILKKTYLQLLTKKLKSYEQSILNKVDGIASITEKDKQQLLNFGCKKPIENIPFGINIEEYKNSIGSQSNTLFHIGSMDWIPNQEAIKWFLDEVWSEISNSFSENKFYLAGRKMPSWLLHKKQKNLIVIGEVDNAINFINKHQIMIVPLFVGSGMRIKIIEAMALGKTVIATSIAAEGINYKNNENILIANTAEEFINTITRCLTNESLTTKIGVNAKNIVTINYDNKLIVNNLVQFFKHIIR